MELAANDHNMIIPVSVEFIKLKKALEWFKKIEINQGNSLESNLIILDKNQTLKKVMKGIFHISKNYEAAESLIQVSNLDININLKGHRQ